MPAPPQLCSQQEGSPRSWPLIGVPRVDCPNPHSFRARPGASSSLWNLPDRTRVLGIRLALVLTPTASFQEFLLFRGPFHSAWPHEPDLYKMITVQSPWVALRPWTLWKGVKWRISIYFLLHSLCPPLPPFSFPPSLLFSLPPTSTVYLLWRKRSARCWEYGTKVTIPGLKKQRQGLPWQSSGWDFTFPCKGLGFDP